MAEVDRDWKKRKRMSWHMTNVVKEINVRPEWQELAGYAIPADAMRISNSEIQSWKRCRRKWFLHYYLGWQPDPLQSAPTGASLMGTRGHIALQAFYGHGMNPLTVLHAIYAYEMERRPAAQEDLRSEYDGLVAILEGYAEWLTEESADRGLIPVGAEQEMSYPLGEILGWNVWLSAHLDVVVFDQHTSRYMFMDHKFLASFDVLNDLAMNEQMKTYVMLQRLTATAAGGTPVNGGIFNMLKRSKRTARATPPFYKREHVTYNELEIKSMWYRTYATVSEIVAMRQKLDAASAFDAGRDIDGHLDYRDTVQQSLVPPTPAMDCHWSCPFWKQCVMMDDGSRWGAAMSAAFTKGDPYAYYGRGLLQQLMEAGRL